MKISRLIGIITMLQQKGKVTAPYLAERFEVSCRTIQRDVEEICQAGIPLVTTRGKDGGIRIMEGFQLDTTVFTREELEAVFVGLKSLDSVSGSKKHMRLGEKLGAVPGTEHMTIDLASFYKDSLSRKIELLNDAIRESRCVRFHYYSKKGEEDKLVEPVRLVFQWSAWYLFGYCPAREDFRLYKLNRLWELQLTEEGFEPREIPAERLRFGQNMTDDIVITALYEPGEAYRLVEEYGPGSYQVREDGRLFTEWGFSSYEKAMEWFLGFGSRVQVTAPEEFREMLTAELKKALGQYDIQLSHFVCYNEGRKREAGASCGKEGIRMIDSRCGLHCTGCEFKEPCSCGGCIETNGVPFHGECPVAVCCQEKGFCHCGECPEFPCKLLQDYSEDPEHGDNPPGKRIEQCRKWREEK